jgi:ankyrin repeat protein
LEAAKHGHSIAKSLAHRAVTAFSAPLESTIPTQWLLRSIEMGCLGAIEDFVHFVSQPGRADAAQLLSIAIYRLRNFTAGVGVGNFLDPEGSRLNTLSIESEHEFEHRLSTKSRTPGFDVNKFTVNSHGDRLLHLAAACDFSEATRFIIQLFGQQLDINVVNDDGETAMLSASRAGQSETVRILLKNGADLRSSKKGESPLHWLGAFFSDYTDIASLMLRSVGEGQRRLRLHQKASKVAYSPYWGSEFPAGTPLHRAVHFGFPGVVETLLDLGADPNEPDGVDPQLSALQLACSRHQAIVLDTMLTRMNVNDVNSFTSPPLLHTALSRYSKLQGLVENGINARDAQGLKDTVAILMSRKANPNLLVDDSGKLGYGVTALYIAVQSASIHAVEIVLSDPLLRPASNLETPSGEESLTPLELAVQNGSLDIVKALLSAGAQPKRPLADGPAMQCMSVLHACALMRESTPPAHQIEIFNRLVPYFSDGLDVGYGGHRITGTAGHVFESPFCLALRLQQFDLVSALLEGGANIDFEFDTLIDGSSGRDDHIEPFKSGQHFESQITVLGSLLAFQTPALISSIRFLLGYDISGKKKNDWPHAKPSPVVCRATNWTVWHAVAMRNNKTIAYAADLTRETLSYLKEAYGQDLVNSRSQRLSPDDVGGQTALHIAAECSNTEVVVALLRMGVDVDAKDSTGAKAFDYALALMKEDIEFDAKLNWIKNIAIRERERRKQVYTLLGGKVDIFI